MWEINIITETPPPPSTKKKINGLGISHLYSFSSLSFLNFACRIFATWQSRKILHVLIKKLLYFYKHLDTFGFEQLHQRG